MGVLGPGEDAERKQLESGDDDEIQDAEVVDEVPGEDVDEEAVNKEG